ncbi:hypothetical protein [Streptomyces sp. sk2.1]|uniref:hypothetical protein n=1 Tax=Streptomyces sp. sk2.1 TaxID=2478959 RepID=UPI0011E7ECEF|nr:hypothetical protein [Streptomyces sp. sk2.1]TXS60174.1 hypothetical protein EAO76_42070 [Streptomyces sp. sk2.1]
MSDTQRMNESLKSFKGYESFRMKGEFRSEISVGVDLRADRQGNCVGTYKQNQVPDEIIIIRDRGWVRHGDKNLDETRKFAKIYMPDKLAAVDEAIKKSRGKYVEYPARDLLEAPGVFLCAFHLAFMKVPAKVSRAKEMGNPRTRGGERTIQLTHGSGAGEVSVHVPEKGGNTPRGIEFNLGDVPVLLELDEYDRPVTVKPPAPADVVQEKEVRALDLASDLPGD